MANISKIKVNGTTYTLKDASAARVNDSTVSSTTTWSSQKIQNMYGPVSSTPVYINAIPTDETRPAILFKIIE